MMVCNTQDYWTLSITWYSKKHKRTHKLNPCQLNSLWFQQDGAIAHSTWFSMAALKEMFPGRFISHFRNINWAAAHLIFWHQITFFGAKSKARCTRHIPSTLMTWNNKFGSVFKESLTKSYMLWHPCCLNCRGVLNKEVILKMSYSNSNA
jgi:hypothetical protein